jgi:hypothetical protein
MKKKTDKDLFLEMLIAHGPIYVGARAIAARLNCTRRHAYNELAKKRVPNAFQIGSRWVMTERTMKRQPGH